jgi:hypothetical protein
MSSWQDERFAVPGNRRLSGDGVALCLQDCQAHHSLKYDKYEALQIRLDEM